MGSVRFEKDNNTMQDFPISNGDNQTQTLDIDFSPSSVRHGVSSATVISQGAAQPNRGSRHRSFTSVRTASVRSSGIAAARCMSTEATRIKTNPTLSSHQDQQKQDNAKISCPGVDCIKKCNGTASLRDPTSFIRTNTCEEDQSHENDCSPGDTQDKFMDGIKSRIKNSRVRKLFNDVTMDESEETINITGYTMMGKTDWPLFGDHVVAGLSYVGSEEPGEQLQENALGIVDKILLINDVELFGEPGPRNSICGKSPPFSSAMGAQSLAKRTDLRNPLEKTGIYDWNDSREDEGGGDFFTKRKDVLLEDREHMRISHTQLGKPKHPTRGMVDNLGGKGEGMDSQTRQKLVASSHLGLGLTLGDQIRSTKVQHSGTKSKKNLFKQIDEQSNEESLEQESEITAFRGGSQGIYDVGVSTQLAAEALEALVCGPPANHDFTDAHPVTRKMTKGSDIDPTKKIEKQKHVSTGKRARSTSVARNSSRKQLKDSNVMDLRRESPVKTRAWLKCEEYLNTANYVNGNECSGRKSSKIGKREKKVGASSGTHAKEVDNSHSSLASNRHLSYNKGVVQEEHLHGTVIPVACRTRQSIKRGISFVTDASDHLTVQEKSSNLAPDQIRKLRKSKMGQSDMWGIDHLHALGYPKRRRTRWSMSADLNNATNLTVVGFPEGNAESSTQQTRSKIEVGSSFRTLDAVKRKTRSAAMDTLPSAPLVMDMLPKPDVASGDDPKRQTEKKAISRPRIMRELRLDATQAAQTRALKDMRRRRDMANVRVLFSHHLGEDKIKQQKKILSRLGVSIASSSSNATHFVADKFVRTRNMLEAMSLGKPVVTHLWLESCGQARCFIDEKNYILRDIKKEKEIGFSMPVSLARACHNPLLQGKRVFITPNVKPDKELLVSLVKAVCGQAIERVGRSAMKDDKAPGDLLVISCEEDYAICVPLLEKGAEVYSSELLLNGIVIQKLEYDRHQLFMDHVKRTRSTIWLRKEDGQQFHPVTKRT
ncbi:uncharacterized protein LOC131225506 [Magnolia sinica]|uniref:uncharacterized protein LOC131225506 n=1 Tax=Magnolia sinica TaxID=86752 RepID=UPI0026599486|nr:uncharacterized protein LOC131225506 [Magnolia sinica]